MALGAITPQAADPHSQQGGVPVALGDIVMTVTNVVADSSYATGGSALTFAQLGLSNVLFTQSEQVGAASGAVTGGLGNTFYNTATQKLQCFNNAGTEVAAATNMNSAVIQIIAFGLK